MRERLGEFGIVDARELNVRTRRIRERTENIEDGALTNLLARTNGMFHGRMKLGGEHEADADFINGFANLLRREVEIKSKRGEDIRTAALR
jgi:hypothetical protein